MSWKPGRLGRRVRADSSDGVHQNCATIQAMQPELTAMDWEIFLPRPGLGCVKYQVGVDRCRLGDRT